MSLDTTVRFDDGTEWRIGVVQLPPGSIQLSADKRSYVVDDSTRLVVIPPSFPSDIVSQNATKENPQIKTMSNGNYYKCWWDYTDVNYCTLEPYLADGTKFGWITMWPIIRYDDYSPIQQVYTNKWALTGATYFMTDGNYTFLVISNDGRQQQQWIYSKTKPSGFLTGRWTNLGFDPDNLKEPGDWSGLLCPAYTNIESFDKTLQFFAGVIAPPEVFPGGDNNDDPPGGITPYYPSGETVPIPGLPFDIISASGIINLYSPSIAQTAALSQWLWSKDFFDNIQKMWASPLEGLISLSVVPYSPAAGTAVPIKLGNLTSEVTAATIGAYTQINCGSRLIPAMFGTAHDYNPYTTVDLFLPFVGYVRLDTDDVIGATISITYNIDNLTGAATAMVHSSGGRMGGKCYSYQCNVASQVPLSGSNMQQLYRSILTIATTAVGGAIAIGASGGAATPLVAGAAGASTSATMTGVAATSIGAVMGSKMHTDRGGGLSGSAGILDTLTPYIMVHRPAPSRAESYQYYNGYPSNTTVNLGSCSGFTIVDKIRLTGFTCTDGEKEEIEQLLKSGVIL